MKYLADSISIRIFSSRILFYLNSLSFNKLIKLLILGINFDVSIFLMNINFVFHYFFNIASVFINNTLNNFVRHC
jgi:hypothetical protein